MMDTMAVPEPSELLKSDGSIHLPEVSKWSEIASKANMVVAMQKSDSWEDLTKAMPELLPKLQVIEQKQNQLAALLKCLSDTLPAAVAALTSVLLCQSMDSLHNEDWAAVCDSIQKLKDMNLALRFSFDIVSVLGVNAGKYFKGQLERMTKLFAVCGSAAGWMSPG